MFERYTEKARRTIFFARYEAAQVRSPFIETEHLLLGLIREEKNIFVSVLRVGAAEEIEREIHTQTPPVPQTSSTSVDLPLTDESKRALAYAAEEAEALQHRHIGTEHLFLGLLRDGNTLAGQLLLKYGVTLPAARELVRKRPAAPSGVGFGGVGFARAGPPGTIFIHGERLNIAYLESLAVPLRASPGSSRTGNHAISSSSELRAA